MHIAYFSLSELRSRMHDMFCKYVPINHMEMNKMNLVI